MRTQTLSQLKPVLMLASDVITVQRAAFRARRTEKTIRIWCREYGIARQSGKWSPLEISAPALEMVMHGDFETLEILRNGNRTHESVVRYFQHLGLPIQSAS